MAPDAMLSRALHMFLRQREASVFAVAVLLFIYFAITNGDRLHHGSPRQHCPSTWRAVRHHRHRRGLLLICLEIDLSVGFVWTLSPYVMHFLVDSGIPTLLAIAAHGAAAGVVVGGINGFVTAIFGVPSLITTLATGYIIFGYIADDLRAQQVNIPTSRWASASWFGHRRVVRDHLGHRPGPDLPRDPDPDPVGPVHGLRRR